MNAMTPTLHDVLGLLNQLAPLELAESWDNPGLQVGDLSQGISKICVSLDPTLESLRASLKQGAQLLLTHHPLIFKAVNSLDVHSYPADVILEAARGGISIVAVHTNLDMAQMGINDMLAGQLGLREVVVLREIDGRAGCGLGRIGTLPSPVLLSSFVQDVKEILGTDRLRLVGNLEKQIRCVAVVGGSGGSLIKDAFDKGADLLVTGDIGHHEALEARALGLALVDGGHFLTERLGLRKFTEYFEDTLKERDWEVRVTFLKDEIDPMYWM